MFGRYIIGAALASLATSAAHFAAVDRFDLVPTRYSTGHANNGRGRFHPRLSMNNGRGRFHPRLSMNTGRPHEHRREIARNTRRARRQDVGVPA